MEDFKQVDFKKYKFMEDCYGHKCDIESLEIITNRINNCFETKQGNFLNLCVSLYDLKKLFLSDKAWYRGFDCDIGRFTFERYVLEFGFEVRYVEKCIQCVNKFILFSAGAGGYEFDPLFKDFSGSKLFELLSVSYDQLEKDIKNKKLSSDMTFKEIRDYVKSLKGTVKKENQVLEELTQDVNVEIDYNPTQCYDKQYFESLSKDELIDCILKLQDYCQNKLEGRL